MSLRSYIQDRPMPLVWAWKLTEKVLLLMRPLFERVGMERSSRIVKLPEELIKGALFNCQDCAQCVLHYSGMTCPMNCPKNLRNGPCGGVRLNVQLRSQAGNGVRVGGRGPPCGQDALRAGNLPPESAGGLAAQGPGVVGDVCTGARPSHDRQ